MSSKQEINRMIKASIFKNNENSLNRDMDKFTQSYRERTPVVSDPFSQNIEPEVLQPTFIRTKFGEIDTHGNIFRGGDDLLVSSKQKREELNKMIDGIRKQEPEVVNHPTTFPDITEDYDMASLILASMKNYKRAKNLFNSSSKEEKFSSIGRLFD